MAPTASARSAAARRRSAGALALPAIIARVRTFLRRYPNVAPAGEHKRMRSDFVNGIKYLPVTLNG